MRHQRARGCALCGLGLLARLGSARGAGAALALYLPGVSQPCCWLVGRGGWSCPASPRHADRRAGRLRLAALPATGPRLAPAPFLLRAVGVDVRYGALTAASASPQRGQRRQQCCSRQQRRGRCPRRGAGRRVRRRTARAAGGSASATCSHRARGRWPGCGRGLCRSRSSPWGAGSHGLLRLRLGGLPLAAGARTAGSTPPCAVRQLLCGAAAAGANRGGRLLRWPLAPTEALGWQRWSLRTHKGLPHHSCSPQGLRSALPAPQACRQQRPPPPLRPRGCASASRPAAGTHWWFAVPHAGAGSGARPLWWASAAAFPARRQNGALKVPRSPTFLLFEDSVSISDPLVRTQQPLSHAPGRADDAPSDSLPSTSSCAPPSR